MVNDGSTDEAGEAVLRYAAENGCLIADSGGSDSKAEPVLAGAGREDCQRQPRGQDERERMSQKLKISEGKSWPEFKVLRQENAGPGSARNRGLTEATGDFIHFFDSDDIAAPNKHEVQLRALLESGVDIAYGPWVKGRFVNLTTEDTENTEEEAVLSLGKPSGAAFSNPSTSELARDSENTSLIRSADDPASLPATGYSPPVTTGSPVLRLIRHEVSAGYIVRRNEGAR